MAPHSNRGRLTVNLQGKWWMYANLIPQGSECLGTVTTQRGETGVLIRTGVGIYARLNAGALVSLPQGKVQAAIDAALAGKS